MVRCPSPSVRKNARLRPSLDEGGARANEASPNCSEPGPEVARGRAQGRYIVSYYYDMI